VAADETETVLISVVQGMGGNAGGEFGDQPPALTNLDLREHLGRHPAGNRDKETCQKNRDYYGYRLHFAPSGKIDMNQKRPRDTCAL